MNSKEKRIQHELDYIKFLETRLSSANYKRKATPEEIEETKNKLKKARLVLKILQK